MIFGDKLISRIFYFLNNGYNSFEKFPLVTVLDISIELSKYLIISTDNKFFHIQIIVRYLYPGNN